jgi:transposase
MTWQPSKLTRAQMEERRLEAGRLLREGLVSRAEIARRLGVTKGAVTQWAQRLGRARSFAPLRARKAPGPRSKLTERQWAEVLAALRAGAVASGFATERWTLPRVAQLIRDRFGVRYHPNYLGEPLRKRGFSPQRPEVRPRERDEERVRQWRRVQWPRIKKKPPASAP